MVTNNIINNIIMVNNNIIMVSNPNVIHVSSLLN